MKGKDEPASLDTEHMASLQVVQQGMIGQSRMPESNALLCCV